MLNGLIFIFIGMQFPYVLKNIPTGNVGPYTIYALLITVVALLIRMLRVYMQKINLQKAFGKNNKRVKEDMLLDSRNSFIISWSGMRGIVSLAVAIGLPTTLTDGNPFPMRNEIIFISVASVLFTLLGQGLTLPMIVKRLFPPKHTPHL